MKDGASNLTLAGESPAFKGAIDLLNGSLSVYGHIGKKGNEKDLAVNTVAGTALSGSNGGNPKDINVFGKVNEGGILAPGMPGGGPRAPDAFGPMVSGMMPGIFSVSGGVTFSSSGALEIQIDGTEAGKGYSQLDVAQGVSLGDSSLDVFLGARPSYGAEYTIIQSLDSTPLTGRFAGLPNDGSILPISFDGTTYQFAITYDAGPAHNNVVLTDITMSGVPEPSSLVLLLVGGISALASGLLRRRTRQA